MDDTQYDFADSLEVQEEDGSWEKVTIFRHKVTKGVCLFFGGSDYEGLPDLFTFIDGVLRDDDGEEIKTRAREKEEENVDNEGVVDGEEVSVSTCVDAKVGEVVKDKKQEEIMSEVVDHEHDLYLGDGVQPDWMSDSSFDDL